MSYRKNKNTVKTVVIAVAGFLVLVMCMTMVGKMSDGFTNTDVLDWTMNERNEENLLLLENLDLKYAGGYDFNVKLDEKDGTVSLYSGKLDLAQSAEIGTVTLPEGTYTFTTAKDGVNRQATRSGVNMYLMANGEKVAVADYGLLGDGPTFELEAETTLTLYLTIPADCEINNLTLYPAIVSGDTALPYYVMK